MIVAGYKRTYRRLVFNQTLIIAAQSGNKQKTMYTLKAMYPLLSFGTLAAHIEHVVGQLAELEQGFRDPRGSKTRAQDVLIIW